MANDASWKAFFVAWPADLPRRGVLVTNFGEQVPFAGFQTSEGLLLIERAVPDPLGTRAIILPYEHVLALKITDVLKPKALRDTGFQGPPPKGT